MSGKGDTPRPCTVSKQQFDDNWARTFVPRAEAPAPENIGGSFSVKFTGQLSLVIGLEGHGPMMLRVSDDVELVQRVVRLVLDACDNETVVDEYDEHERQQLAQLLA